MIMLLSIGRKVGLSFVSPSAAGASGTGVGVGGRGVLRDRRAGAGDVARARARERAFNRIVPPLRETSGGKARGGAPQPPENLRDLQVTLGSVEDLPHLARQRVRRERLREEGRARGPGCPAARWRRPCTPTCRARASRAARRPVARASSRPFMPRHDDVGHENVDRRLAVARHRDGLGRAPGRDHLVAAHAGACSARRRTSGSSSTSRMVSDPVAGATAEGAGWPCVERLLACGAGRS